MITDYSIIEKRLSETFNLHRRPVAIMFNETPPAGVEKFTGTEPSGCSFWRIVASTGCIGNRVYTDIEENALYIVVPGKDLQKIAD
jgi:hypothetical protein